MLPILGHVAIIGAHLNGGAPSLGIVIENIFDWFYFFITLHHIATAAKTPPVNHVGTALVFIQSVLAGFRHLPGL